MDYGIDDCWSDGVCCNYVLVKAPAEKIAAACGEPTCLLNSKGQVTEVDQSRIKAYMAQYKNSDWLFLSENT